MEFYPYLIMEFYPYLMLYAIKDQSLPDSFGLAERILGLYGPSGEIQPMGRRCEYDPKLSELADS